MLRSKTTVAITFAIILFFSSLIFPNAISAQASLDTSFNGTGKVTTSLGVLKSWANDAVLQSDGKIVAVGGYGVPTSDNSADRQVAVVRYNNDGTLDTTFDTDGKLITTAVAGRVSEAMAAAITTDGKILLAAWIAGGSQGNSLALIRYNSDGSLDTTFDNDGVRVTSLPGTPIPRDMKLQPDGKIIVACSGWISGSGSVLITTRFDQNGLADSSFGSSGYVYFAYGGSAVSTEPASIGLRSNGKIIVTGIDTSKAVIQYNSNGTTDTTFGTNGVVSGIAGYRLAIQSTGKTLVVDRNTDFPSNTKQTVTRLNEDGSIDPTFGINGSTTITFVNQAGDLAAPFDMAVQTDDKVMLGGSIRLLNSSTGFDMAAARLTADGALDNTFAFNGRITTDLSGNDHGMSILIQPDGKIILTGQSGDHIGSVRYLPIPSNNLCRPMIDIDGDGKSDVAYYTSAGKWNYWLSTGSLHELKWGLDTDILVPFDFNGDCRTDLGVFRNGTWYIQPSVSPYPIYANFGMTGDIPVPGYYDGDGLIDLAIYRGGTWWINQSTDGVKAYQFGLPADKPVPADYDGDGKTDIAVYRNGTWWIDRSSGGIRAVNFGIAGDKAVPADYDGDGKADVAIFRDGVWWLDRSTAGTIGIQFGLATDVPVPADYNGDGKVDIAVYRSGTWYILYLLSSGPDVATLTYGGAPDRPVQASFFHY